MADAQFRAERQIGDRRHKRLAVRADGVKAIIAGEALVILRQLEPVDADGDVVDRLDEKLALPDLEVATDLRCAAEERKRRGGIDFAVRVAQHDDGQRIHLHVDAGGSAIGRIEQRKGIDQHAVPGSGDLHRRLTQVGLQRRRGRGKAPGFVTFSRFREADRRKLGRQREDEQERDIIADGRGHRVSGNGRPPLLRCHRKIEGAIEHRE